MLIANFLKTRVFRNQVQLVEEQRAFLRRMQELQFRARNGNPPQPQAAPGAIGGMNQEGGELQGVVQQDEAPQQAAQQGVAQEEAAPQEAAQQGIAPQAEEQEAEMGEGGGAPLNEPGGVAEQFVPPLQNGADPFDMDPDALEAAAVAAAADLAEEDGEGAVQGWIEVLGLAQWSIPQLFVHVLGAATMALVGVGACLWLPTLAFRSIIVAIECVAITVV